MKVVQLVASLAAVGGLQLEFARPPPCRARVVAVRCSAGDEMTTLPPVPSEIAARFASWQGAAFAASERQPQTVTVQETCMRDNEPSRRITKFVGEAFEDLGSTTQGIRAAKSGRLLVDGEPADMNRHVKPGDVVELLPRAEDSVAVVDIDRQIKFTEGLCQCGALTVAYEDEHLAVVNKPAGIHTTPYGRHSELSLEHALPGVLSPPVTATDALVRPTAVHRLDARVAGLLVVAKTRQSAAFLAAAFRERRVQKRYRALLLGRLDAEELLRLQSHNPTNNPIEGVEVVAEVDEEGGEGGDPNRGEVRITSSMAGKRAVTLLSVRECTPHVQAGWLTSVDVKPLTGRRHQLRKHCADLGFPICGDDLYAAAGGIADGGFIGKKSTGLFLQSVEVRLPHPTEAGRWLSFETPEAAKFKRVCERGRMGWEFDQQEQGGVASRAAEVERQAAARARASQ